MIDYEWTARKLLEIWDSLGRPNGYFTIRELDQLLELEQQRKDRHTAKIIPLWEDKNYENN